MVITRGFEGEAFFNPCFCRKNDSYRYFKIYLKEFGEEEGEVA